MCLIASTGIELWVRDVHVVVAELTAGSFAALMGSERIAFGAGVWLQPRPKRLKMPACTHSWLQDRPSVSVSWLVTIACLTAPRWEPGTVLVWECRQRTPITGCQSTTKFSRRRGVLAWRSSFSNYFLFLLLLFLLIPPYALSKVMIILFPHFIWWQLFLFIQISRMLWLLIFL